MLAVVITGAGYDLSRETPTGHLATDSGLRTTVLLLLLTEGRALDEDVRPGQAKGGYWGNSYPDVANWELGSRLHILTQRKASNQTAALIEQEIRARLQCLIDDRIAASIKVEVTWAGDRWNALVGVYQDTSTVEWVSLWEET